MASFTAFPLWELFESPGGTALWLNSLTPHSLHHTQTRTGRFAFTESCFSPGLLLCLSNGGSQSFLSWVAWNLKAFQGEIPQWDSGPSHIAHVSAALLQGCVSLAGFLCFRTRHWLLLCPVPVLCGRKKKYNLIQKHIFQTLHINIEHYIWDTLLLTDITGPQLQSI